jgi:DNA-binding response OmpR family regulator
VLVVVDDDVLVRSPVAEYLRECGYEVIEAANANEALSVLSEPKITVNVVLTAVEMSGPMSGFALSQWVRKNQPEVRTLLSGTPKRAASIAGALCEEGPILARPCEPRMVEDHIRRLLASRRTANA